MPTFWDAAGNKISKSSIGNNILFHGREYDAELNLYYFRARYYDPIMGRFLQTDPMGYQDSMNLYQAFGMNPVNFNDPFGDAIDSPTRFNQYNYNPNAGFWGLTWEGSSKGMYEHGGEALAFGALFALDAAAIPADKALDFFEWASQETGIAKLLGFKPGEVKEVLGLTAILLGGQPETAMVGTAARANLSRLNVFGKYFGRAKNFLQNILPTIKTSKKTNVNRIGSIKPITRESLIEGLIGYTSQGNRISKGIKLGKINLNVLGDELFIKIFKMKGGKGSVEKLRGFAIGDQIYIRGSFKNVLSTIIHEGTHTLDYLKGFSGKIKQWEKRAYFYQRQFQIAGGDIIEFESIADIIAHIGKYY
jgi:RHS repeat-associated protein